ncbi:MAG TPA: sulfite exporter TauE/SafE family protein [Burkholderiales bacterium]|nr:sulfite exporter TauE/SafE family protein [Burkholderiales bacterium]
MALDGLIAAAAVLAGALASVAGFGIGSLLTPAFGLASGTQLAVAAVAIPHFVGTAQRYWMLRAHVDRRMLFGFGATSAVGGLAGALLHGSLSSRALSLVFGALLLAAGTAELTGWMQRVRWGRRSAWLAGALSGLFGGMVGNQGSIRSAAMLGFDVPKQAFVATATAVALFVDLARLPVYLAGQGRELAPLLPAIGVAVLGVMIGTAAGARLLGRLPQRTFRRTVALLLLALGVYVLAAG